MGKVEFESGDLPRQIGTRGHCGGISMGKVQGVKFDLPQTMPGPSPAPATPAARLVPRCQHLLPSSAPTSAPGLRGGRRHRRVRLGKRLLPSSAPTSAPGHRGGRRRRRVRLGEAPTSVLCTYFRPRCFEAGGGTGAFGWVSAYFRPRASRRAAAPARSASVSPYFAIRGKYFFSRRLSLVERARRMLFRMAVRSSGCFLRMAL